MKNNNLKKIINYYPGLENFALSDVQSTVNFLDSMYLLHNGTPKITRKKSCLYCNKVNCIKSHSISENALLTLSGDNLNIYKFNDKLFFLKVIHGIINGIPHFSQLGVDAYLNEIPCSNASTFDGSCNPCDTKLFSSLDNGYTNEVRIVWELLYRTIAYRIRFLEEFVSMESTIIKHIKNNLSFTEHFSIMLPQISKYYSNLEIVEKGIMGAQSAINALYSELNDVKQSKSNLPLFLDEYLLH